MVGLDYASILHQEQTLLVRGKGNKGRLTFMPERVWQRIHLRTDTISGEQERPFLTRIRAGDDVTSQRIMSQAFYHILGQCRSESGIDECTPLDLRRTFIGMMLDNGKDLCLGCYRAFQRHHDAKI